MNDRYLRGCRQFYITYPQILNVINGLELPKKIWRSVTPKFRDTTINEQKSVKADRLVGKLSFTHLLQLCKETDPLKRAFYEIQAIKGNWSVRELERQRGSLLYERTGLSKDKQKLLEITGSLHHADAPQFYPSEYTTTDACRS